MTSTDQEVNYDAETRTKNRGPKEYGTKHGPVDRL